MIRIDSNQAFSLPSAKYLAPGFEEAGVRNWEDPTPDWEEIRALRSIRWASQKRSVMYQPAVEPCWNSWKGKNCRVLLLLQNRDLLSNRIKFSISNHKMNEEPKDTPNSRIIQK